MSNINNIQNNNFLTGLSKETSEKNHGDRTKLQQEDFLKLLVTQMSNQDPVNPQDPESFLGQLAQFGTVDGIAKLNNAVEKLNSGLFSNQALQASSLVGRNIQLATNKGYLSSDQVLSGKVIVDQPTNNLKMTISNSSGEVVKQLHLGDANAGEINFQWDGLNDRGEIVSPGIYQVKAEGINGYKNTAFTTLMNAKVDSVTIGQGNKDVALNLKGLGAVALNDIKQIS